MSTFWKNFRTNLMYWRFRHITRHRLRLRNWWYHRRQPGATYRPRGSAAYVHHRSVTRTWIAVLIMVAALTAVREIGHQMSGVAALSPAIDALIIVGAIYWCLRQI